MDFQKGSMVLNGVSVDRTSLINFEKNLEAVPEITQVTIPISSFEKETDLEFQLSFQYTKNLPLQQLNQIKAGNAK
jgi:hypothetical protein